MTEADEAVAGYALKNYAQKVREYLCGEETMGVLQMYEDAALKAGFSAGEVADVWRVGGLVRSSEGEV